MGKWWCEKEISGLRDKNGSEKKEVLEKGCRCVRCNKEFLFLLTTKF